MLMRTRRAKASSDLRVRSTRATAVTAAQGVLRLGLLFALGSGCAKVSPSVAPEMVRQAGLDAALPDAGPVAECGEGDTQPCTCDNPGGTGLRACIGGTFGSCNGCGLGSGSTTKCVAGRYEGKFSMAYTPGPAGICGVATLFGGSGSGALNFTLEKSDLGEFYEVGDGCVQGTSDAVDAGLVQLGAEVFAKGVVFRAVLSGVVDCATGRFEGEMRGTYRSTSVCGLGIAPDNFFFKGPISGTFDPAANGFTDGKLTLHEPPVSVPLAGEPGGVGSWMATLANDSDGGSLGFLDGGTGGECLGGVMFKDFTLPGDASTGP
jgi:hypothetical protein